VEEHFVWMTTRQIQPGTLGDFERAWRPDTHPESMLRAYAYWSEDEREIVGELIDRQKAGKASEQSAWAGVARVLLNLEEFTARE